MRTRRFRNAAQGPGPGIVLALGVCLAITACAVVESPPGGPIDAQPPVLFAVDPDSGAVNLPETSVLRFTFSEKMDRTSAAAWLHLFPERKFRKTTWHGATQAEVILEEPIPADTVVVVEISGGMKDAHKVANRLSRRFPIATASGIPTGRITGSLAMADTGLAGGVLELYAVPPDTLEYFQQPMLRRTVSNRNGQFAFEWLPVPGGPYLIRAFADGDGNLRLGEKETRRLLPDTLRLSAASAAAVIGPLELFPLDTPGRLVLGPAPWLGRTGPCLAFAQAIAVQDSGWGRAPAAYDSASFVLLSPAGGDTLGNLKPGPNRLVIFADLDADSCLTALPLGEIAGYTDSLGWAIIDPQVDTLAVYLEPTLVLEPVLIEPGLTLRFALPDSGFSLVPRPAAATDSSAASAAPSDTLTAAGDSLGVAAAPVDSLGAVPAVADSLAGQEVEDE